MAKIAAATGVPKTAPNGKSSEDRIPEDISDFQEY
jgi:hypothetical protein